MTSGPGSFEEAAAELSRPLLHYLRTYVGDPATAEDLLQETLIRMSRGLASFRGDASLKTWAFSIATRVAADHFRKPETRLPTIGPDEARTSFDPLDVLDVPDPDVAIDERVIVDEMNACVREVIDSLPESYRAPLVLHDLEGLSVAETAAICQSPLPATKIRIHRARRRLREALRAQCELYRDGRNVLRCARVP